MCVCVGATLEAVGGSRSPLGALSTGERRPDREERETETRESDACDRAFSPRASRLGGVRASVCVVGGACVIFFDLCGEIQIRGRPTHIADGGVGAGVGVGVDSRQAGAKPAEAAPGHLWAAGGSEQHPP